VPGWPGHRAGQHVDVRLTAEDGYQAERSYSIASAPAGTRVALTVHRARGRRGLPLPDRRAPAGRQDRATRPDRRLLRLGAFRGRPADARGRRIGHRAADGDDPDARRRRRRHADAVALLLTQPGRRHLSRRARAATASPSCTRSQIRNLPGGRATRAVSTPRCSPRFRLRRPSGRASTRADRRRSSRRWPNRSCGLDTTRGRSRPNASDPPDGDMGELMLDGNAIAGLLQEVFAVEMTTAIGTCGGCGAARPVGPFTSTEVPASCSAARTATTCSPRTSRMIRRSGSTSRESELWKSRSSLSVGSPARRPAAVSRPKRAVKPVRSRSALRMSSLLVILPTSWRVAGAAVP